uniref:Uncharacterized protein n=1 Tax=Heterorhabditis bacteriophora TaxID=37862 RepID=A0A1I7XUQ9_HETBA
MLFKCGNPKNFLKAHHLVLSLHDIRHVKQEVVNHLSETNLFRFKPIVAHLSVLRCYKATD